KTRLQREVVLHLLGEGDLEYVVQQRNDPYGQRRALGAALDVVRSLLRLPKDATESVASAALLSHTKRTPSQQPSTRVDVLARLLCSRPSHPATDDPQAVRDVLWLLMTDVVQKSLEQGPVVITCEDIQWADPESLSWFEHVLSRAKDRTLLLMLTARHEFWSAHPDAFSKHDHIK